MARETKRDKIVRYLADNGIDILKYEITATTRYHESEYRKYHKAGTILIEGFYGSRKSIYLEVDSLTGWDSAAGKTRPIDLKTPYHKDNWGNVDWFKRDDTVARIEWIGD